jgi:tetratricopeptide (TPR) repeat protein
VEAKLVDADYRIDPDVAEAGREQAGPEVRDSVDIELASFWKAVYQQSWEKQDPGMEGQIWRAGLSAVPYLMRQRRWNEAGALVEQVVTRDNSPATVAETLPLLQYIAEATEGTADGLLNAGVFARAFRAAGRTEEAVAILKKVEQQAVGMGQYRPALAAAGDLANLLWRAGHVEEALTTVDRGKEHIRMAELGHWTLLANEVQRLQILSAVERHEEVLAAVQTWRDKMNGWPEFSGENETVVPWNVREALLNTGAAAALRLKRWQEVLSLNEELIQAKVSRGATALEVARARYNNHESLLALKRYSEARRLLDDCLSVFELSGDRDELGLIHGAIADLEDDLQHFEEAARHEGAALGFIYTDLQPKACAISHYNLANYLFRTDADPRVPLAHRLAGALIFHQTNDDDLPNNLHAVRRDLARVGPRDLPAGFDELCRLVEQTEGVRFRELFSGLPQRAASGDEALRTVLEMAGPPEPDRKMPEPIRNLFEAAASGQDVEPMLAALQVQLADNPQAVDIMAQLRAALAQAKAKAEGPE